MLLNITVNYNYMVVNMAKRRFVECEKERPKCRGLRDALSKWRKRCSVFADSNEMLPVAS